jgi:hypothetical protein
MLFHRIKASGPNLFIISNKRTKHTEARGVGGIRAAVKEKTDFRTFKCREMNFAV